MQEKNQDSFERAYATLHALRSNIDNITTAGARVEEKYVEEYHAALDTLQRIGIDVAQFRIPPSEVQHREPIITVTYPGTERPKQYTKEKYVAKALLLTKLDEVLIYLDNTLSEKPRKIGFSLPDKS